MKKINFKKTMALALSIVMALAICAVPAFADTVAYTPVAGGTTTFGQALIVDENAGVPTATVSYSIAAGAYREPASAAEREVMPGLNPGSITISNAVFGPADTANLANPCAGVTLESNEKAVAKEVTVDLSAVSFPEPGIYRYIITMTNADEQGMSYDTQPENASNANFVTKTRVLDVYVTDDGQGVLSVSSKVLHELNKATEEVANEGDAVSDKSGAGGSDAVGGGIAFVNAYSTYDLAVSKSVSGNQASRDKYFKFTIAIANAGANCDLQVSGAAAAPTKSGTTDYAAADMATANTADDRASTAAVAATEWYVNSDTTNPYNSQADAEAAAAALEPAGVVSDNAVAASGVPGLQWTTNASGAVQKDVYLKHGDTVTISGLAAGATYTVTEVPEDYTPATSLVKGSDAAITGDAAAVSESTGMAADHALAYTNSRSGMIPTGVVMSIIPGIALIGIGGGFAIVTARKNRKEED